jgi:hypothetical protein
MPDNLAESTDDRIVRPQLVCLALMDGEPTIAPADCPVDRRE